MTDVLDVVGYRILIDGAILSSLATIVILLSLYAEPRMWLQDLPRDIRDAVPPKTRDEKRRSLLWGIPLGAVMFGVPVWSCLVVARQLGSKASFGMLWADAFGVAMVFNLVDLVLIDWVIVCWVTPSFLVIPGTAGLAGYKDYGHHFRGFLIGVLGLSAVAALIAAAVRALA